MKIQVKLYGTLPKGRLADTYCNGNEIEVKAGATVSDVLMTLGIPAATHIAVVIDGRVKNTDDPVAEGDCLWIFEALHGG